MYNRYIPGSGGYTRITVEEPEDRPQHTPPAPPPALEPPPQRPPQQSQPGQTYHRPPQQSQPEQTYHRPPQHSQGGFSSIPGGQGLLDGLAAPLRLLTGEDKNAGIAGILKSLNLEELDSGDVLLLLIMLFLFLEGDNLELVITLALMLLLSLGDEKKKKEEPPSEMGREQHTQHDTHEEGAAD